MGSIEVVNLLLLHGMGATGQVWDGVRAELGDRWPGLVLSPDLPGHGVADALPRYSFGSMAGAIGSALDPSEPTVVLGHSLGGVLALTLASGWFGVRVKAVCGLDIKVVWTEDELAGAAALAGKPQRHFPEREAAADRHIKVSGLTGLVTDPDSPMVSSGITESQQGWTLRFDSKAFAVGAPDMAGLLAAAKAPVLLAAGADDHMVSAQQLAALGVEPRILPGLGHNAHVQDPAAVAKLVLGLV
ncbi:alpha/beta hydrolase [Pseudonocardiaceae bacterium YIM PH 21723]|nr:alpha/beta hydrolase [Pseudonocardiaceae bacterium YIM PH 21723]